jgi:hypothetical protein
MLKETLESNKDYNNEIQRLRCRLQAESVDCKEDSILKLRLENYKLILDAYKTKIITLNSSISELEQILSLLQSKTKININIYTKSGELSSESLHKLKSEAEILASSTEQLSETQSYENLLKLHNDLNREIQTKNTQIQMLNKQIPTQQQEYSDIITSNEKLISHLQNNNTKLLSEAHDEAIAIQKAIENVTQEKNNQVGLIQRELNIALQRVQDLNQHNQDIKNEKKGLLLDLNDLKEKEGAVKSELALLREIIAKEKEWRENEVKKNEDERNATVLLKEQVQELQNLNKNLEIDIQSKEKKEEIIQESCNKIKEDLLKQIEELKQREDILKQQNKVFKEELEQKLKISIEETGHAKEDVQKMEIEGELNLEESKEMKDTEKKQDNSVLLVLKLDNQALESNLERIRTDFLNLREKHEEIQKELNSIKAAYLILTNQEKVGS